MKTSKKNKRRDFIKNSLKAGIGATLLKVNTSYANKTKGSLVEKKIANPKKVVVGGAGISGLCVAYELMKLGHDVTVLEASERHGGHVYTVQDELSDGLYGDGGHVPNPN